MSNDNESVEIEAAFFDGVENDPPAQPSTAPSGAQASQKQEEETERVHRAPGPRMPTAVATAVTAAMTPSPGPVGAGDETQLMTPAPRSAPVGPAVLTSGGDTQMMTPAPGAKGGPALTVSSDLGADIHSEVTMPLELDVHVEAPAHLSAAPEPDSTMRYQRQTRAAPAILPPASPLAPSLPYAPIVSRARDELPPEEVAQFRAQIDALVSEAQARAGEPGAAALWFEAGRIYEDELNDLVQAANHYQASNEADETFLPVLHAARRLFAKLNNWQLVVALIEKERALGGGHEPTLLVEKGRILETHLNQTDEAATHYERALALEAHFSPALVALQRILLKNEDYQKLAEVLEAAAVSENEPRLRAELYIELGRHCEARLNRDEDAMRHFEMAGALSPGQPGVLAALRRLYARVGENDALAGVYLQSARATEDERDAVQFLLSRARMLDLADGLTSLEEAYSIDPNDTLVLTELCRVYQVTEDWESLARTLQGLVENTNDRLEVVALHAEAGRILEENIGDFDRAVANYRACLLVDPSYQPAHQALGRLYAKTGQWDELIKAYDEQIAGAKSDSDGVRMRFNQAELLVEQGHAERATTRLEEILALQPGYLPAAKLLSRLYGQSKSWSKLVAMYEEELKTQDDAHQAVFLLDKIGQIYEQDLNDYDLAADAYCRMRDRVPDYLPALRALGRIYAKAQKWEELIAINTDEAQSVGDRNHIVSLMFRNGEIYADRLNDAEQAIAAFTQALTLMPNYLPALKSLGRIFAKTGRYADLISMHKKESEVTRDPTQRAHLLLTAARIFDEQLDDVASAAKTYREILDENPTYHPAIRELARIAERSGDWPFLVEVYAQQVAVMKEPQDRALTRCRAAKILERNLERDDDAVALLEDAVADAPTLLTAHQTLITLHARRGDADKEVRARLRMAEYLPDERSQLANAKAIAELYRYRLDRPDLAFETGERVAELASRDVAALGEVVGAALAIPDYAQAIRMLERQAMIEPEASEAARCYLQIAALKQDHVEPPQDPLPAFLRVLEYDPLNATALREVERHYIERGAWEGLYALYEREREAASDKVRIVDLSMKMGGIAERKFAREEIAAEQFEAALSVDENYLPAIARLKAIYGKSNKPEDELRMLAFEAQASKDPTRAIEIFLEVGSLQRDRFNNIAASAESFFQVLARDPQNEQAASALEELLVGNGQWADLSRLYEVQAAASATQAKRIEYRHKAAHIVAERLNDLEGACAHYQEVLGVEPNNRIALQHLAELQHRMGQHDQSALTIERLVEIGGDPQDIAPLQKLLGSIYVLHQDEPKKAITTLNASLAINPADKEARRLLAKAYAIGGSPTQAFQVHQQLLADATTDDERREEHLALADLYETTFSDLPQAAAQLEKAIEISTDAATQNALMDRLVGMYERAGDLEGYVKTAEKLANEAAQRDPEQSAQLFVRCAQLYADRREYDRAATIIQGGLNALGEHERLRIFLADLYTNIPTQSARAIEEHRRIVRSGNVRTQSLHALFQLWSHQKAYDRAYVAAELLAVLKSTTDEEDLFLHENSRRVLSDAGENLSPGEVTSLLLHPDERNAAHDVLFIIATDLGKVNAADLSAYQVDRKNILNKRSDDSLRKLTNRLVGAMGGMNYEVHRTEAHPQIVAAKNHHPVVLVVGSGITRTHPTRAQRFLLGQKVAALRLGHQLLDEGDEENCKRFFSAVGRAVDKNFPAFTSGPEVDALQKRIASALSRSLKRALIEPVGQLAEVGAKIDWGAFLRALALTEARAGLLLGGDTVAAFTLLGASLEQRAGATPDEIRALLGESPAHQDLAAYALSDQHFVARQRLQYAIDA